jgi:hypothetical protein
MGEEMARFKGCLTPRIEGGGRGNGHGMRYDAQGSDSMADKVRAVLPCFGAEGGRSGWVAQVGQKAEQADGVASPSWARN